MKKLLLATFGVFLLAIAAAAFRAAPTSAQATAGKQADDWIMYIGTYTTAPSKGIYAYRFEGATGAVTPMGAAGLAVETENPSFLAVHPNQRFLYAVNEVSNYQGGKDGSISAFSIDRATGTLTLLNRVSSHGADPCHLSIDRSGKWLFVANYSGGSVAAFPVRDDGTLGVASSFFQHEGASVNKQRQSGPHAHAVVVSPDSRFLLTVDLGMDQVHTHAIDPGTGGLGHVVSPFTTLAPGSGPRHLAFRPDGKFAYVLNEMLSTVAAFSYDAGQGTLAHLQTLSTLPPGFTAENSGAEIVVHPGGRFVYTSNRGLDSIAVFGIDAAKGTLTPVDGISTQGKTPRGFAIDPSGRFLVAANQNSSTLVVFRIDPATGALTPARTTVQVPTPVSVVFVKKGP